MIHPFAGPEIAAVFEAYPPERRRHLLRLRALILDEAAKHTAIGATVETLKWGQPAYYPARPRLGTTVRIDSHAHATDGYALFFHCQTTLADTIRGLYPGVFTLEGDRALLFSPKAPPPEAPARHVVALALTYHLNRRKRLAAV